MPYKAPHPCGHPGCPELTHNRYCEKHQVAQRSPYGTDTRKANARKYYDTARWRELRKVKLAAEPLCEICKARGKLISASHIDHIKEINDGGHPFDLANLQSLCKSCHSSKTLRTRNQRGVVYELQTHEPKEKEWRF